MRASLSLVLVASPGCFVVSEMHAEEPCAQTMARYAQRLYACAGDPELAKERTHKLEEAHTCRIEAWGGTGFLDTGWTAVQMVQTDAGNLPLPYAWSCSESMAAESCESVVEADPASGWLETVAGCAQIFAGPGGTETGTGSTYGY